MTAIPLPYRCHFAPTHHRILLSFRCTCPLFSFALSTSTFSFPSVPSFLTVSRPVAHHRHASACATPSAPICCIGPHAGASALHPLGVRTSALHLTKAAGAFILAAGPPTGPRTRDPTSFFHARDAHREQTAPGAPSEVGQTSLGHPASLGLSASCRSSQTNVCTSNSAETARGCRSRTQKVARLP